MFAFLGRCWNALTSCCRKKDRLIDANNSHQQYDSTNEQKEEKKEDTTNSNSTSRNSSTSSVSDKLVTIPITPEQNSTPSQSESKPETSSWCTLKSITLDACTLGCTAVMSYFGWKQNNDENADYQLYIALSGLASGALFKIGNYTFRNKIFQTIIKYFEKLNILEVMTQSLLIDFYGPWNSVRTHLILLLWGSTRAGMLTVDTGRNLLMNGSNSQAETFAYPVSDKNTADRHWLIPTFSVTSLITSWTLSRYGLNTFQSEIGSMIATDAAFASSGLLPGYLIGKRWPMIHKVITAIIQLLGTSIIRPGPKIINHVLMFFAGLMLGYSLGSGEERITQRRNIIATQSNSFNNITISNLSAIKIELKKSDAISCGRFSIRWGFIKTIAFGIAPLISYFLKKDSATISRQLYAYATLVGSYLLGSLINLPPVEDYHYFKNNSDLWPTIRKNLNFHLNENPILIGSLYTYSVQLLNILFQQPASCTDLTSLSDQALTNCYILFCILAGTAFSNTNHAPHLNKKIMDSIEAKEGKQEIFLSTPEKNYVVNLYRFLNNQTPENNRNKVLTIVHKDELISPKSTAETVATGMSFMKDATGPFMPTSILVMC